MRSAICFAAMVFATYAGAPSQAQVPAADGHVVPVRLVTPPPPEAVQAAPAEIESARLIKRTLTIGNRTIVVDQVAGS